MTNEQKIKEAKHILTMLEADEINHGEVNTSIAMLLDDTCKERFMCGEFHRIRRVFKNFNGNIEENIIGARRYTKSLDACQSLMLEGWFIDRIYTLKDGFITNLNKEIRIYGVVGIINELSPPMPTMPLAWLHAILQSYICEWSQ